MTTLPAFRVHVAGEPGPDRQQRCVPCGAVLIDNRPWRGGRVAVMDGDDQGPSWWPPGALVATDKVPGESTASITYVVDAPDRLDDDEQPCTPAPEQ